MIIMYDDDNRSNNYYDENNDNDNYDNNNIVIISIYLTQSLLKLIIYYRIHDISPTFTSDTREYCETCM